MLDIYDDYFILTCPICNNKNKYNYSDITLGYYQEHASYNGANILALECTYCNSTTFFVLPSAIKTMLNLAVAEIFDKGLKAGASISSGLTQTDIENILGDKEKLSDYFTLPKTDINTYYYIPVALKYYKAYDLRDKVLNDGAKIYHETEEELNGYLNLLGITGNIFNIIKKRQGY